MAYNQRRRPPSPRRNGDAMFRFGSNDSRHNDSRNSFDFRAPNHAAPNFPPTGPRRDGQRNGRYNKNDRRDNGPRRPRGNFGFRKKVGASERAILFSHREATPERLAGMSSGDTSFRIIDGEESDNDDSEVVIADVSEPASAANIVDISSDDSEEEDHPRAKRAKTAAESAADKEADSKPKWSNPDPYTALPPPGESTAPRTNVLDMIRKAKVQNDNAADQVAKVDDFISLNFDDEAGEVVSISSDEEEYVPDAGARGSLPERGADRYVPASDQGFSIRGEANRGRYDRGRSRSPPRHEYGYSRYSRSPEESDRRGGRYSPPLRDGYSRYDSYSNYPPPQSYDRYDDRYDDRYNDRNPYARGGYSSTMNSAPPSSSNYQQPPTHPRMQAPPPPPPAHTQDPRAPPPPPQHQTRSLDQWPPPPPVPMPQGAADKKRKRGALINGAAVTSDWLARGNPRDTPWMDYCNSKHTPESWLRDEVENFYYFVAPRTAERHLRADLISRVQNAFSVGYTPRTVLAFGSSATHLYLPTGDVDLVILSDYYQRTRIPQILTNRGQLNKMVREIVTGQNMGYQPMTIPKAKVPLIKYIDRKTGLPVDISFENDSGLAAIETLNVWLSDYPALNRLVFPLKQFLKMRGLNEVNSGGLGGFSTICLVAFRLHNLAIQHGPDWALKNLDLALIDVFEYFGNFNVNIYGLDMQTMTLVDKPSWSGMRVSQPGRLLIVDPNNPENDISGGSGKVQTIFDAFEAAADSLKAELQRAQTVRHSKPTRWSMLNCVLGANYSSFTSQRARLDRLFQEEQRLKPDGHLVDLTGSDDEYDPSEVTARIGTVRVAADDMSATLTPQEMSVSSFKNAYIQQHHSSSSYAAAPKKTSKRKAEEAPSQPSKKSKHKKNPPTSKQSAPASTSAPVQKEEHKPSRKDRRIEQSAKAAKKNKEKAAVAANKPAPPLPKKPETATERKARQADVQRAQSFRQSYPGVPCPPKLKKSQFKDLVRKQPTPAP